MNLFKRLSSALNAFINPMENNIESTSEYEEGVYLGSESKVLKLGQEHAYSSFSPTIQETSDIEQLQKATSFQEVQSRLDELFANLVGPLSQLRMQQALMSAGKDISSKSIMAIAKQLADIVESMGLVHIGETGESVEYDPKRFRPLNSDVEVEPGEHVIVRIIGYEREGRIVRKAFVEKE